MAPSDALSLGLILSAAGLVFWLATHLLARVPVPQTAGRVAQTAPVETLPVEQGEAILVIQAGGRPVYANARARDLFHLRQQELPNLERLAKRIRPSEQFINLCASSQQVRFVLDGRLVEGTSYPLAVHPDPLMVVSLRDPGLTANLASGQAGNNPQTLQTFVELSQAMAASLDLTTTLQTILENIEKIVPADSMEIGIWEPGTEKLTLYRLTGMDGAERKLEISRNPAGESYSAKLVKERRPVLAAEVDPRPEKTAGGEPSGMPLRSYLGVPLLAGQELIGTLELSSSTSAAFRPEDLEVISLLSGQAAVAVHNARLYQDERQRSAELSGLAQLSQAFGSAREPRTLFSGLVESILPLIHVKILGFLLYNEIQRSLEGQAPFHGLPEQFLDLYKVFAPPNSRLDQALMEQHVLITENAAEDATWESLGLGSLARAASLRETVLIPLSSGGRMLGYLQASNHHQPGAVFSQDELHLLVIVANQAAPIIDNFNLIQQSRQRAQRAEALRRIASLASSAATLQEILKFSLQELSRLLNADVAAVFLFDQNAGEIQFQAASMFGRLPALPESISRLGRDDPQFHFTVTGSQRPLFTTSLSQEPAVIPFYQAVQAFWMVESVVIVPLVVRDEGIGELWLASQSVNCFDRGSQQVAATAAGQLGGVVEQSFLAAQTDESLRRRVEQLTALTRISRELSMSLDLKYLLQLVYDEALQTTRAECGTILLFDLNRPLPGGPRTRFFIGDEPAKELTALERQVLDSNEPLNIPDVIRAGYAPGHEGVQSALLVPVVYHQRQAGLIALHSPLLNRFDATAVEISQSLAVQAAVVLGNALQYEEQTQHGEVLKRELETLAKLFDVSRTLQPNMPLDQLLQALGQAIRAATPFQVVVISLYEAESGNLRRMHAEGLSAQAWLELQAHQQPWEAVQALLQPLFRVGQAYFIPADRRPPAVDMLHSIRVLPEVTSHETDVWDANDLLLAPLYDRDGQPFGLISVDSPRGGQRPDWQTFEALEMFTLQAAAMLQNNRYAVQLEQQARALESEARRWQTEAEETSRQIPSLVETVQVQGQAVRSLQRQVERMHNGLDLADQANRQPNRLAVLQTVARELLERFGLQAALLAEKNTSGPQLIDVIGNLPPGSNPQVLFGQRNPLRQMLLDGEIRLAADLDNEPEWGGNALLRTLGARSFVGLPLAMTGDQMAGVLVVGMDPLPPFGDEDRQALAQVAHQVSVGLQNLDLLTQARRRLKEMDILLDFSRKLGSFTPAEILHALLDSALQILPAAQAGWAGLWDARSGELIPQVASGYSDNASLLSMHLVRPAGLALAADPMLPLPLRVLATGKAQRVQEVQFTRDYNLPTEDLLCYRRATGGRLPLSDMVAPVQLNEKTLGVLVLENFSSAAVFAEEDENLLLSLAQQAALALENSRLLQSAEARASQLQALTRVAGTITTSLRSEDLIASLLGQLREVLPYETSTLWLRRAGSLTVAAARGFEHDTALVGLSVDVEDSQLFQEMITTGQPISVPDVRLDARFPKLAEPERFSWLGIPLIAKGQLTGLIALEKAQADFYSEEHLRGATTFASQAAVALENARLFEESERRAAELDERSRRLALLNRLSGALGLSLDSDYILKMVAQELQGAFGVARVAALMLNSAGQMQVQAEFPTGQAHIPLALPAVPLFEHLQKSRGLLNSVDAAQETGLAPLYQAYLEPGGIHSLLAVPLLAGTDLLGWLVLQTEQEHHFSLAEMELARTISNQSATAIQNARLFAETRRLTEDLERRVQERTTELTREHHNSQTLLRILSELSASLDMSLVLNRTLTVLNESAGSESSLIVIASTGKTYTAGKDIPGEGVVQDLAQRVTRLRRAVVLGNVQDDPDWSSLSATDVFRSILAVPLVLGEEGLGALILFHGQTNFFSDSQVRLVEATARQISISLNNADLFNLIRDQAEHLGGMLREQQVEASRSRAILEAVADGVLVTEANNTITMLNASAERILDLKAEQVLVQSLDQFSGLFGKAASTWMETIHNWSENTHLNGEGESFAEQIQLENGRIVSVHLAPVILRSEFLGTVSIFRDITHEVQIDRLKSEFVANVSHELRTPMTSIKGYVEILLMGAAGDLDPRVRHFLEIVKVNTERLSILVNDLLDVSKIESGRVTLSLQPLDMGEIAKDVLADINRRSREENRPMKFNLEMSRSLPRVYGDLERVRQILGNLVSNAYAYTPEEGQVTVRMRAAGQQVEVDVQDNGIGIVPQDQRRIFERFYRGEDPLVLASAGTGLGLAITRALVEMHHGRIWFTSSGVRGKGSVFSFALPIYETGNSQP